MGFFEKIFGTKTQQNTTSIQLLNGYNATWTPFSGNNFDVETVRTCVDAIARNFAKIKFIHMVDNKETSDNLNYLLQTRPNMYMDAYSFLYKIVASLYVQNNAFIYIDMDQNGKVNALYPVLASSAEIVEYQNVLCLKFSFMNGRQITLPYEEIIHLRRFYYSNDLLGENNNCLTQTIQTMQTSKDSITNAVKNSSAIRGIITYNAMLNEKDIKASRDRFVAEYMNLDNNGGIGALDAKATFQSTNMQPVTIDEKQMTFLKQNIYNYYGVSEEIITSNYNENQWNAFYESVLETIAIPLALELTAKCFTAKEQLTHKIAFESNRLSYASLTTKIDMLKELTAMGYMTINEGREILNLAPVSDGDERMVSLNYIKASDQSKYQVGQAGQVNTDNNKQQ